MPRWLVVKWSDSEYVFERKNKIVIQVKYAQFDSFYNNENHYYFIDNRMIVVYPPY